MKTRIITRVAVLFLFAVIAVACRSSRTYPTKRTPAPVFSKSKPLPPGQAKKIYGHQSAKAFAPGQQKKKVSSSKSSHPSKKKKGKKH